MSCCCCEDKSLKVFKNYPTEFADVDWLSIIFESEPIDLTNFEAQFILGDINREWTDITQGITINLTEQETNSLPVGLNYGTLIVTDTSGNSKPFSTAIPIEVLTWVEGDQELDTYNMTVNALLDNEVQMVIRIETAKVSLDWVNGKIAEHNNSSVSHPYILGLIDDEKQARINVDSQLSDRIDSISSDLSNYRTAAQQDIIDNNQNEAIASKQNQLSQSQLNAVNSGITSQRVSSYDGHVANTTIHVTSQEKQIWNNKQNAISDIDTIRFNARAGKSASDTIANYGNIVTHNVSEFATSAQGELADTALQPTDIIDNTSSNDTDKPLSANMGKSLQDQVDNLKARGRFLALWNCATGLAESNPPSGTYTYQSGDYFIVGVVAQAGQNNYKPDGSTYTTGVASTVIETQPVDTDDVYYYDGHVWRLQVNTQKEIGFVNIAGDPYDNTALASALNNKQNTIDDLDYIRSGAALGATAVQGVQVNGVDLTPDANKKVNVQVPTNNNQLINGAGYITSSALNGYATQTWVGQQGFLTSTALVGYATEQWVTNQGYLTSSALNGYATEQWVQNRGYITQAVDDSSTTSTTLGWSASKLNGIIGDIESTINAIRGV